MNLDYKDSKVTIPLAIVVAVILATGGYWLKGEFIAKAEAEQFLDQIYIRQDVYRQSQIDNRIYRLRDQIQDVLDIAHFDNRALSPWEQSKVERLQTEIKNLGANP